MESVKRYSVAGKSVMYETTDGEWVVAMDFDRVTAEREALQLLLNNRDDLDDKLTSLEQRRHAEQQACQAAERRVKELETQLAEAREDLDECDGDRHRLRDKCAALETFAEQMARQEGVPYYASLAKAALNPTAEAVSHVD